MRHVTALLSAIIGALVLAGVCGAVARAGATEKQEGRDKDLPGPSPLLPPLPPRAPSEPVIAVRPSPVHAAVVVLQPWYGRTANERDARRVAGIIEAAARESDIDPLLATAIAMRESSLRMGSDIVGSRGELGLFQVMPRSYALRVCSQQGRCDLSQPRCNARVALCYLAHVRELCPGSTWRWVAAYGMSRCPTEREARSMTTTRRARAFLVQAVGAERAQAVWPEG